MLGIGNREDPPVSWIEGCRVQYREGEVDATNSETARSVRCGEVLAGRGVTKMALDEEGRLTHCHRDGTTSLIP